MLVLNKETIGGLRIFTNDTQINDDLSSSTSQAIDEMIVDGGQDYSNIMRESGFLWDRIVPVNDIRSGYDFVYDYKSQYIYWLEHNTSYSAVDIKKVKFDGEDRSTLVSHDLIDYDHFDSIFSFEFDPASRNLFLANFAQSQIEVISIDTKHRTLIYLGYNTEIGVGRPTAITINSEDAEVYWIDNGLESVPIKIGILLNSSFKSNLA